MKYSVNKIVAIERIKKAMMPASCDRERYFNAGMFRAIAEISMTADTDEWIPVSVALPETLGGWYACTAEDENGHRRVTYLQFGKAPKDSPDAFKNGCGFGLIFANGMHETVKVVAWRPCMSPYTGKA